MLAGDVLPPGKLAGWRFLVDEEKVVMFPCCRRFLTKPLLAALGLALFSGVSSPALRAQTSVLTQNNDNSRTGANPTETTLTPANVNQNQFGKLFTITGLDAYVNGQALYVPNVTIRGTMHNVLYVYTTLAAGAATDNSPCSLYAFDADTGAQLWHTPLPNSAPYTTAAPVIDPATNILYVLTKTAPDDTGATYMRAYNITNGVDMPGSPIRVQATVPGTGDGSVGGFVHFDGPASSGNYHENDRAALLLLNGVVYCSFARQTDSFPYHGWIFGYKYAGNQFTRTAVFCTTPNGSEGGVWQAGKGLAADAAGYIYCSVGNGTFDANTGGKDYGMCYLKLRASDLSVADYFAPYDEQSLSNSDLDLGNSGVVGIPGTNRLFGGGTKFGAGFLLNTSSLGGFNPNGSGPDNVVLQLNGITGNDSVGQNPIAWDASSTKYVYLWAGGSNLEQFRYVPGPNVPDTTGTFNPAGVFKQTTGMTSGGSLAISSNGSSSGILWAVGGDSVVRAFNATDVTLPALWTSAQNSSRDGLPSVGHFQFPTVVNGKVYVPTNSHSIVVYGLLPLANALSNASFETPSVGSASYQYNPTGGAWSFTGYSGIQSNGSAWYAANAPDGTQTAFLQGYPGPGGLGSISQSVNFTAAGNYALTFQAARRLGQVQPLRFSVDGVQVGGLLTPPGSSFAPLTSATFSIGTAGAHTLTLSATDNSGDLSTLVDQVNLSPK